MDLTNDIAREKNLKLDMAGYEKAMAEQRKRSQAAGNFQLDYTKALKLEGETEFTGYEKLEQQATVVALYCDEQAVETLEAEQQGLVILDSTPFYAESGGQVGDCGYIEASGTKLEVRDVTRASSHHVHHVRVLNGAIKKGDSVSARVDADVRRATALNHSATHLLHAALRKVLGEHVTQKGSLNDSERLRFDFSHTAAVSSEELERIEDMVNEQVRLDSAVETAVTDMETAQQKGALALFGEKYGDKVRVLTMGDGFSVELCGGTHVQRTGEIGMMLIVAESGVAAGVRRIEALTGRAALDHVRSNACRLQNVAGLLKCNAESIENKLEALIAGQKKAEKDIQQLKAKLASSSGSDLAADALDVGGIKVLASRIDGADRKTLLTTMDQLRNKLGDAVILLAGVEGDNIALVAGVSKSLTDRIKAGDLMKHVAGQVGGKGGGRPDSAQGGGNDVAALPAALKALPDWVKEQAGQAI